MKVRLTALALFAFLAAGLLSLDQATGQDKDKDKVPTIKEIMGKLNKGENSLCPTLGKALKADSVNWTDIQPKTKEFQEFADALGKNPPPKGEKSNWEKLTKAYAAAAKELNDAAVKMDQKAAQAAQTTLANACKACHTEHRPQKKK